MQRPVTDVDTLDTVELPVDVAIGGTIELADIAVLDGQVEGHITLDHGDHTYTRLDPSDLVPGGPREGTLTTAD